VGGRRGEEAREALRKREANEALRGPPCASPETRAWGRGGRGHSIAARAGLVRGLAALRNRPRLGRPAPARL